MQRILRQWLAVTAVTALFLVPQAALGEERDLESPPWAEFGAKVGVFPSATASRFRMGTGVGLDIFEIAYSYSFIQDDRLDLAVGVGLNVMPIDFGVKATGPVEAVAEAISR